MTRVDMWYQINNKDAYTDIIIYFHSYFSKISAELREADFNY